MRRTMIRVALLPILLTGCSGTPPRVSPEDVEREVADVERAFAATMARRDHDAFVSFLSDETVFIAGENVKRGRQAVAEDWQRYFDGEQAPFSWAPVTVTVLESGELALSTGPVWNDEGDRVATFTSIWRLEAPGTWRIVFDRGQRYCD